MKKIKIYDRMLKKRSGSFKIMPKQIEIERKYVIKMPALDILKCRDGYTESKILQIYIESEAGVTHRIRKRSYENKSVYTQTKKSRIDSISSFEEENEISEERFCALSKEIKSGTLPVIKTRYTFTYNENTFEIDVYPNWKRSAIMETELASRDASVKMPPFIEIIREVTGDFRYSNAAMASEFPEELI